MPATDRSRSLWGVCACAILASVFVQGCGFDFDAPFAESGEGGANNDSGVSGSGGLGGSSGSGGTRVDGGGTGGAGGEGATGGTSGATGGTSGASGGTSGASGAGTGGSGGVEAGTETCANGVDDDGNGAIDCADPACSEYACAPAAPAGWQGPVLASLTSGGGGDAVQCPSDWPERMTGGSEPSAGQASCFPCLCESPHGATCGLPTTTVFDPGNCSPGGEIDVFIPLVADDCQDLIGMNVADSAIGDPIPVTGGVCDATGGGASFTPAQWAVDFVACIGTSTGGGCNSGSVCVPRPQEPFASSHCIVRDGDVPCPSGVYGSKYTFYASLVDERGCTSCSCGSPMGQSCGGMSYLYETNGCMPGSDSPVFHDGSCANVNGARSARYVPDGLGPLGGMCTPAGGQPIGQVTPTEPITLCCP